MNGPNERDDEANHGQPNSGLALVDDAARETVQHTKACKQCCRRDCKSHSHAQIRKKKGLWTATVLQSPLTLLAGRNGRAGSRTHLVQAELVLDTRGIVERKPMVGSDRDDGSNDSAHSEDAKSL